MSGLMLEMSSDDSWVDGMGHEHKDHVGHRIVDLLRDTGEWPSNFARATRYKGRKHSVDLDRAVMYRRLSKFLQFVYVSLLIICGFGPVAMSAASHDPQYLMYTVMILAIPPLWYLEVKCYHRGLVGKHSTVENRDNRSVWLYDPKRDVRTARYLEAKR